MVTALCSFLAGIVSATVALALLGRRWSRERNELGGGSTVNVPVKFIEARAIRTAATALERVLGENKTKLSADARECVKLLRGVAGDLARDAVDEASEEQMANMARLEDVDLDAVTPTLTAGAERAE